MNIIRSQYSPPPTINDTINLGFEQVQNALTQQQECNMHFNAHIGSLEVTSQCIDSKIDVLLAKMDDSYPTSHKYQHTSSPPDDPLLPPGQGHTFKCTRSTIIMPNVNDVTAQPEIMIAHHPSFVKNPYLCKQNYALTKTNKTKIKNKNKNKK
jgi:hypothetical protein